ncbi:Protein transport protein S9 plasma membrane t-SNARE [Arthrobotrys conoides]|uniref:Protein transport protein S9 plasma membrane t-SNARE n=1 Tax=Arthrobotrys conoides TaxID=74498 RepID=A0AAN8NA65_9PEZI
MGLFKKKDKTARASPASGVPDTTVTHAQPTQNPYAYSPPPPGYVSQPSYNEPTSYGRRNNEPTTYGGSIYSQRSTEPSVYGGSESSYGGSKGPEAGPYGGSVYANNNGPSNLNSSNPYGASAYGNNNRSSNVASSNPYGAPAQNQYGNQKPQSNNNPVPNDTYSSAAAGRGDYHYGSTSYQDSYSYQTTALAEDEQDPEIIKQEIKYTKYASHASTVNALHAAARAEQAGQSTLLGLEQQGESLYNTQLNLKLAKTHGDIAAHQAKDLKVANRPLFMPHVKNPFSSGQEKIIDEQVSLEKQRRQRAERGYGAGAGGAKLTHEDKMRKMGLAPVGAPKPISKEERAARDRQKSMYQFEADEEDEQLERDIDTNLDLLAGASRRLRGLAGDINQKVDEQNRLIMDINAQAHEVEDGLVRAGHKLRPYGF